MLALKRVLSGSCLGLVAALGTAPACSSDDGGSELNDSGAEGANGNSGGSSGSDGNSSSNGSSDTTTGSIDVDAGSSGSGSGDDACAGETTDAVPIPLDVYFMVDTSESMVLETSAGVSKWDAVRDALQSFFGNQSLGDIGIGLQFFPQQHPEVPFTCQTHDECGPGAPCYVSGCENLELLPCLTDAHCIFTDENGAEVDGGPCRQFGSCPPELDMGPEYVCLCADDRSNCLPLDSTCLYGSDCNAAVYQTPQVEIAPLSESAEALTSALAAKEPYGTTPTAGALSGAIAHLRQRSADYPDHRMITVLATDGLPSPECVGEDVLSLEDAIAEVADVAAAGYDTAPNVQTFVIGVFAPEEAELVQELLDSVANAGGTNEAFVIETTSDVAAQFETALNEIRNAAIVCDFEIPQPTSGVLDYGRVNVQLTTSSGTQTLYYVTDASGCDDEGGWYYDVDPSSGDTPSLISVCQSNCDAFKLDGGSVRVQLGCETVIK